MYHDVVEYCQICAEYAVVSGLGCKCVPPLNLIPVQRAFEILGVDIMNLPTTSQGNRYVVVFEDFPTKLHFVFPVPDQNAIHIARLLAEEILPVIGVCCQTGVLTFWLKSCRMYVHYWE